MEPISLSPNIIFNNTYFPINSAYIATLFTIFLIIALLVLINKNLSKVPNRLQTAAEFIVSYFYEKTLEVEKNKDIAKKYTSLVLSIFIFVFIANQFSLIPLVSAITVNGLSAFKTPTAHFSLTIALALTVVILSNVIAFKISPIDHINSIVNIRSVKKVKSIKDIPSFLLEMFLGILNIIGEFAKVISLSARLFGNIFAGEIMVTIIAGLSIFTAYLVPIPFIVIGIFSGVIQAFVFAFLSFSFLTSGVKSAS